MATPHLGTSFARLFRIFREEFSPFERYLQEKKIKFQNELPEKRKSSYRDEDDEDDVNDDPEIPVRSSDEGEDDSSTDEDYQEGDTDESGSQSGSDNGGDD